VVDTATAGAIDAFGTIAGDARKGFLSGELRQELERTAVEVSTLNAPETVVTKEGVDISQSDPTGIVDQTRDSFKSLAIARSQGTIDLNRAGIEAEVLLKAAIAKAPGFADEFRQQASQAIGFDVSGAATRTLFGNPQAASTRRLTPLEKAKETAELLFASGEFKTFNDALNTVLEKEARETQAASLRARIETNSIIASDAATQSSNLMEKDILDALAPFRAQINEVGGIDSAAAKREITNTFTRHKAQAKRALRGKGVVASQNLAIVDETLDKTMQFYIKAVDDDDLGKAMAREAQVLQDWITIQGINLAPELAIYSETLGQAGIEYFLTSADSFGDDIEAIEAVFPELAAIMKLTQEVPREARLKLLQNIMTQTGKTMSMTDISNPLGVINSGSANPSDSEVELQAAMDDLVAATAGKQGNMQVYSAAVGNMVDLGLENRPLSAVARTRNGYSLLEPERQRQIAATFQSNLVGTINQAARALAGTDVELVFNSQGQTFTGPLDAVLGDPALTTGTFELRSGGVPAKLQQSAIGGGPGGSVPAQAQIQHINTVLSNLLSDPKARLDLNVGSKVQWQDNVLREINRQRREIEQGVLIGEVNQAITESGVNSTEGAVLAGAGRVQRRDTGVFEDEDGNLFFPGKLNPEATPAERVDFTIGKAKVKVPKARKDIADAIEKEATTRGINPQLALAIAKVESSFIPDADNPESTALGLFQNTDANFEDFGEEGKDRTKPEVSINAGLNFLQFLQDKFKGDLDTILIRWHSGPNTKLITEKDLAFAAKVKKELGIKEEEEE
jgi:soluble lytic murein transglycosylase-like protein